MNADKTHENNPFALRSVEDGPPTDARSRPRSSASNDPILPSSALTEEGARRDVHLIAHANGEAAACDLSVDLQGMLGAGQHSVTVWSRTLEQIARHSAGGDTLRLHVDVPAEDFVALHIA